MGQGQPFLSGKNKLRLGSFPQPAARARRDEARRAAEEEERACTTPLPKLPMASGRAALIKGSQLSSTSKVGLNFPPPAISYMGLKINQGLVSYMGLSPSIIQQSPTRSRGT